MPASTTNDAFVSDIGTKVSHANGYTVSCDAVIDVAAATELWLASSERGVFTHPAWWQSAIDTFGRTRRLCVLKVHKGGQLIALWPLWWKRVGMKEGMARVVEPVGMRFTDYCQPLMRAGHDEATILRLLINQCSALLDLQTVLLLAKVPASCFAPAAVEHAARDCGLLVATRAHPCLAMGLPSDLEVLQRRWSKSHRGDVRRQIKRLSQAGKLELVTARERDQIVGLLPALTAMHTANWRARAGGADLGHSPMGLFLDLIAHRLPVDLIDASQVRIAGAPIAYHLGFRQGTTRLWYKPTFDVAWANYAPGKVHVALAAQQAIAEGAARFDFMQGTEPYKHQWADETIATHSYLLAQPRAYPLWFWNAKPRRFALEYRY